MSKRLNTNRTTGNLETTFCESLTNLYIYNSEIGALSNVNTDFSPSLTCPYDASCHVTLSDVCDPWTETCGGASPSLLLPLAFLSLGIGSVSSYDHGCRNLQVY